MYCSFMEYPIGLLRGLKHYPIRVANNTQDSRTRAQVKQINGLASQRRLRSRWCLGTRYWNATGASLPVECELHWPDKTAYNAARRSDRSIGRMGRSPGARLILSNSLRGEWASRRAATSDGGQNGGHVLGDRCRIGALVCVGVFVVLNVVFVAEFASHERPSAVGICLVDAVLLILATTLYRRSRRLVPPIRCVSTIR